MQEQTTIGCAPDKPENMGLKVSLSLRHVREDGEVETQMREGTGTHNHTKASISIHLRIKILYVARCSKVSPASCVHARSENVWSVWARGAPPG